MNWQDAAEALWGDDWIAPLSEVLGINRRTVERWRSGEGTPPKRVEDDLIRLRNRGLTYGCHLRAVANGTPIDVLRRKIREDQAALGRLEADCGKFPSIDALSEQQ